MSASGSGFGGLGASVPVAVLTGFLGAGKTTLLRALLATGEAGRTAVLVNEFGEVGIDHLLVDSISADVVLLDSGCVCCQIRGELKAAVLSLLERRDRGELPPFERLIIETTGLAEPAPIVSTLAMDRVLSHEVSIATIVTVIDALAGGDTAGRRPEWLEQVAAADTLVLSKTDLASPGETRSLIEQLARLNPIAPIVRSGGSSRALSALFDRGAAADRPSAASTAPADVAPNAIYPPARAPRAHGVRSAVLELDGTVDWTAFGIWFSALLHAHGERVLRVKGLLDTGGEGPVLFNGVQHSVYPPEHRARLAVGGATLAAGVHRGRARSGGDPRLLRASRGRRSGTCPSAPGVRVSGDQPGSRRVGLSETPSGPRTTSTATTSPSRRTLSCTDSP